MNLIKSLILAIVVLFLPGCKKYPEDDRRYWFKSAKWRLCQTWNFSKYYMHGADSTNYFYNRKFLGSWIDPHQFSTMKIKTQQYGDKSHGFNFGPGSGNITFENKKNQVEILYDSERNPFVDNRSVWDIKELTIHNLKIQTVIRDTSYLIEFTR